MCNTISVACNLAFGNNRWHCSFDTIDTAAPVSSSIVTGCPSKKQLDTNWDCLSSHRHGTTQTPLGMGAGHLQNVMDCRVVFHLMEPTFALARTTLRTTNSCYMTFFLTLEADSLLKSTLNAYTLKYPAE